MEDEQPVAQPMAPDEFVASVTQSANIAADIDPVRLARIGAECLREYEIDKKSMAEWFKRMEKGVALASLVKEDKSYPFPLAANVKYPLITSAAMQFNARAYPAIVPADRIVMVKTFGSDSDGAKAARADRVSAHMSWQLGSQVEEWDEGTDKLLVQLPIVGTMVRKVWYDPARGRARCRLIEPGKFIVNDKVKTLADAPRVTEEMSLFPSEIMERKLSGNFLDIDLSAGDDSEDTAKAHEFIEQHCRLDLDQDRYPEPYIVTIHVVSQKVVRVVADFEAADVRYLTEIQEDEALVPDPVTGIPVMSVQQKEVATGIKSITRGSYFADYHFVPSLSGGFFSTGLGLLLGDISDTINSILNMLLDAGHMAALGGGWIGSELRLKGGSQRFKPGEWKLAPASGNDVRSAVVPMTFPGPDAVLFQMLGMLIDAGREIASVQDVMTGDSGKQVQTATTTIALIEQGMMVFTAAYKRIFRSLKKEFGLFAKINATTVSAEEYNAFHDEEQPADPRADYSSADMDIVPVADPRSVTKMQEAAKAQLVMQLAETGMVDKAEAAERVLASADIGDREALAVKPDPMAEFMGQMQMELGKAELTQKMADIELTLAKVQQAKTDAAKTMVEADAVQVKMRLDALSVSLEAARDGIQRTIERGFGGMAGQPGNAGGQAMPGLPDFGPQTGGYGQVLGG